MEPLRRDNVERFPERKERSVASLLSDLARDFSLLIRQEVALAKAEASEKVGQLGMGIGMMAAGGFVAFAGLIVLMFAGVYALALVMEPWQAALIVGGVVTLLGLILVFVGKSKLSADKLTPQRTIQSIKDDARWAKEQVR
jgi:lipopolysaccharide export LptBFGC system permease protein LptF